MNLELITDIEEYNFYIPDMDSLPMKAYTADFETTTRLDDCRVWAWAICDIDNTDHVLYGNTIESFMKQIEALASCHLYFHNLGFDGAFIMDWLERNGWLWIEDKKDAADKRYTTLISDANMVYSITLYFTKMFKVTIYDSFKIIPMSIEAMAKAYDLPISKGDLDYTTFREKGHVLTDNEKEYIRGDVQIAAMAMRKFLSQNLNKMTAGSNALMKYKESLGGNKKFRKVYPVLDSEIDDFIRRAYRGGWTYADPRFSNQVIGEGLVFDVNSLYPSVMYNELLPMYKPVWFDGKPKHDERYPLWVACAEISFKVKPDHLPCIQLKNTYRFKATEYITDSHGYVTMMFTSVDWELYKQQYDIKVKKWHGGYKFQGNVYQFRPYIDYWIEEKNNATIEGNSGKRSIAKLMLNSLYGKFATRLQVCSRRPQLVDDILRYVDLPPEEREPVYLPVGVFVTSYARKKTVSTAQSVYDRFLYADTDSIHIMGADLPDIDIDDVRLGAWKHESTFEQAKFLRAKCYIEKEKGSEKLTVHVSGLPLKCHSQVTVENFGFGAIYEGKLYTHRVPGGIVLMEDVMEIRP